MTNQTTQNTSAETTSLFRAAALDYAAMGFKVFPVYEVVRNAKTKAWECACQGRKRKQAAMYGEEAEPCGNPGKHSMGIDSWKKDATADPIIKRWAKEYPNANIGIVTGKESGLWLLDVDGELGEFLLDEMQAGRLAPRKARLRRSRLHSTKRSARVPITSQSLHLPAAPVA